MDVVFMRLIHHFYNLLEENGEIAERRKASTGTGMVLLYGTWYIPFSWYLVPLLFSFRAKPAA